MELSKEQLEDYRNKAIQIFDNQCLNCSKRKAKTKTQRCPLEKYIIVPLYEKRISMIPSRDIEWAFEAHIRNNRCTGFANKEFE